MKEIYQSIRATAEGGHNTIDYRLFWTSGEYNEFYRSMFDRMPFLLRVVDDFFPQVGFSYYKDPNLLRGDARKIYDRLTDYKQSVSPRAAGRLKSSHCLRMTSADDFLNLLITRTSTSFPYRLA